MASESEIESSCVAKNCFNVIICGCVWTSLGTPGGSLGCDGGPPPCPPKGGGCTYGS